VGVEHPNFYENHKEALMRLNHTVVLYDGEPFQIKTISNHKADGIFRVYMQPIGLSPEQQLKDRPFLNVIGNYNPEYPGVGEMYDQAIDGKDTNIIRKMMNSPKFNKFRPYPLGMCNIRGQGTFYVERQPNRKSEQGLIRTMLFETHVTTSGNRSNDLIRREGKIELNSPAFRSCVLADHPSAHECLTQLLDPKVKNEAAAFDRYFAFARGPVNMIFLAYKGDIVGVLPKNDLSHLRLGEEFLHVKETVEELKLFTTIDY
jgi:hypothetical protein